MYLLFETYNIYMDKTPTFIDCTLIYIELGLFCGFSFLLGGCGVTRNKNCQERKKNSVRKIFVLHVSGTKKKQKFIVNY